jgi:hypothetical protein
MSKTKLQLLCDQFIASPTIPEYISPSQINQFLSNKMGFIGRLVGFDRSDNINFQKGNTLERAVNFYFDGVDTKYLNVVPDKLIHAAQGNPDASIEASMIIFKQEASNMEKFDETLEYLPALSMRAIQRYMDYNGRPECQKKIDGEINGARIFGITDYQFANIVSDCKVTGRTPTEMPQSHKNAAYIYQKLTNKDVIYDYFIPLKKEMRHVAFEFECDALTEQLVNMAIESIKDIYSNLSESPNMIKRYSMMFLCDPDQGYGMSEEIQYYMSL